MSCVNPFTDLFVLPAGYSPCCQSWLHPSVPVFDHQTLDPWDAWNHPNFVALRKRVIEGDWSTCTTCPRIESLKLVRDQLQPHHVPVMETGPEKVVLVNDLVCNLRCWSCRPHAIGRTPESEDRRKSRMMELLTTFAPWIRVVSLLFSGEVFASPMHMEWLRTVDPSGYAPGFEINLITNGTLMVRRWDEIENAHDSIKSIIISADAPERASYERIRLGGSFDAMNGGMALAGELRRSGRIRQFVAAMVVQEANFREIPRFVRWAKDHGACEIRITPMLPWWQTPAEIAARSPADERHKDHAEYLRVIECDELREPGVEADQIIGRMKYRQSLFLKGK